MPNPLIDIHYASVASEPRLFFDWYRTTVDCDYEELRFSLAKEFPLSVWDTAPAIRHFGAGLWLDDGSSHKICSLYRVPSTGRPHVIASGFYSPLVALIVQDFQHSVSRVDVATDISGVDLFDVLLSLSRRFCSSRGLNRTVIAPDLPDLGSTIYIGSRASPVFVRVYQVGLLRAKVEGRTGDDISDLERSAVRVELEYKPNHRDAKRAVSTLSPSEVVCSAGWASEFFSLVFGTDFHPIVVPKPRNNDRDKALRHMARQYGRHLTSVMVEVGGDTEAFGSYVWSLVCPPLDV